MKDLMDLRANEADALSLTSQRNNARIWKELGGHRTVTVINTARDAVRLI